ncbi:hypothetical protein TRVL_00585 [Trypanosoma vivax]|nr:hypothetical protein TRVL_00585 [Trypanosoma vivax]
MDGGGSNAQDCEYPRVFTWELIQYCRLHHLPPRLFQDLVALLPSVPRYVRVRSGFPLQDGGPAGPISKVIDRICEGVAVDLGVSRSKVNVVSWLPIPYCVSVPRGASIVRSKLHRSGAISAMDAASMAAVVALRPRRGEIVWDVCCSPGMKLSFMADAVGTKGLAVGTDISVDRLFVARSVLKRHGIHNACILVADGKLFQAKAAAEAVGAEVGTLVKYGHNGLSAREERRLRQCRKRWHGGDLVRGSERADVAPVYITEAVRERLAGFYGEADGCCRFDRVLVDAECSHDGSLAHLFLNDDDKWPFSDGYESTTGQKGIDNAHRMHRLNLSLHDTITDGNEKGALTRLQQLQLELLVNGYTQLKPGGTLVYCTCSFTFEQNEFIVSEMLRAVNGTAESREKQGGEAVLCHPFEYEHEAGQTAELSEEVRLADAQAAQLRQELEKAGDPYGVVTVGAHGGETFMGVRFWPHVLKTSFQFVSKIWKKPLETSTG